MKERLVINKEMSDMISHFLQGQLDEFLRDDKKIRTEGVISFPMSARIGENTSSPFMLRVSIDRPMSMTPTGPINDRYYSTKVVRYGQEE